MSANLTSKQFMHNIEAQRADEIPIRREKKKKKNKSYSELQHQTNPAGPNLTVTSFWMSNRILIATNSIRTNQTRIQAYKPKIRPWSSFSLSVSEWFMRANMHLKYSRRPCFAVHSLSTRAASILFASHSWKEWLPFVFVWVFSVSGDRDLGWKKKDSDLCDYERIIFQ